MDVFVNKGFSYIGNGYKPLCTTKRGLLLYKKHTLFLYKNREFRKFYSFSNTFKGKMIDCNRVLERMTRSEPQTAIEVDDSVFVARRYSILQISVPEGNLINEFKYRKEYIHTDRFSKINNVGGFDNTIVYGEYFSNGKHEEVCIYAYDDASHSFNVVYTFPSNTIRHIHNIIPDNRNDCVYILTGDTDSESGIWIAKDNFRTVVPLLVGNQDYRSCLAFVSDSGITYTTDIPTRFNHVFFYNFKEKNVTSIFDLPGSCTVGCDILGKKLICTSVEAQEPRNRSKSEMIKYLLSRRLAAGMLDDYSHMFYEDKNGIFKEIIKCKKDFWPGGLCRFGRIYPIFDFYSNTLFVFPIAVKQYDGKLYSISIDKLEKIG